MLLQHFVVVLPQLLSLLQCWPYLPPGHDYLALQLPNLFHHRPPPALALPPLPPAQSRPRTPLPPPRAIPPAPRPPLSFPAPPPVTLAMVGSTFARDPLPAGTLDIGSGHDGGAAASAASAAADDPRNDSHPLSVDDCLHYSCQQDPLLAMPPPSGRQLPSLLMNPGRNTGCVFLAFLWLLQQRRLCQPHRPCMAVRPASVT